MFAPPATATRPAENPANPSSMPSNAPPHRRSQPRSDGGEMNEDEKANVETKGK
jgi:hypothetical protein